MTITENRSGLIPDPAALVALVEQLVTRPWPRSDQDRKALFEQLGFSSGDQFDPDRADSATKHFSLTTALKGDVFAGWTAHEGHFMGINLQPYTSIQPNNPDTRRGYDDVRARLTALYGKPTNAWDDGETPPCIWTVTGREITMHFFNRRHSGMMLNIDDAELAAAAEAEARAAASARVHPPELLAAIEEEARRRNQAEPPD